MLQDIELRVAPGETIDLRVRLRRAENVVETVVVPLTVPDTTPGAGGARMRWSSARGAPGAVAGEDIDRFLPAGRDGKAWHAVMNEVQMLFHDHPVNVAREARGIPVPDCW